MRILIADPMRTGTGLLGCALSRVYELRRLGPADTPGRGDAIGVLDWIAGGGFPDGSILQHHSAYSQEFVDALDDVPTHVLAIVRDPYEAFVDQYNQAQSQTEREGRAQRSRQRRSDVMSGKPIDHPDVIGFLGRDLRETLVKVDEWRRSGRATMLRYEDLRVDPAGAIRSLVERFGAVDPARVDLVVSACRAEEERRLARVLRKRGADAAEQRTVADLGDTHLEAFRARYAELVADLGYELREPAGGFAAELEADPEAADDPPEGVDESLIPPLERMRFRYARKGGRENFVKVGDAMVRRFAEIGGLRPDHRVLDVGSGVGRMALALTRYLEPGASYEGFDVDGEGIAWCQENVTPRFPNFRFQVADVYNKHYHPRGSQPASAYRFPFDAAAFDFVFLTSVFTHLLPDDLENYLREISRVLAPGGRCFITMFLLNEQSLAAIEGGQSVRRFPYDKGIYRVEHEEFPERAIAYDEAYARRTFAASGLTIVEPIHLQGWSRRQLSGEGQQDYIVAAKHG